MIMGVKKDSASEFEIPKKNWSRYAWVPGSMEQIRWEDVLSCRYLDAFTRGHALDIACHFNVIIDST